MWDFGNVIFYFLKKIEVFYFISEIRNPKSEIIGNPSYNPNLLFENRFVIKSNDTDKTKT
ncbi:hypothetical protein BWI92_08880 [Flectobacillus sp. BAB-3569]|nr:hypothetical protein BWI92_08880 [Flectobacillus sp. BAB-3569]